MAKMNDKGEWIDPRGKTVPPEYVRPIDRQKDRVVEQCVKDMEKLQAQMLKTKERVMNRLKKFDLKLQKKYETKRSKKGNIMLTNFSGDKQIEFAMKDIIEFDEKLQLAKEVIDEWMREKMKNVDPSLRAVIETAFDVDKKGRINTQAILKLRTLNIKDEKWKKAMNLIGEAISVGGTRQYLVARKRPNSMAKFETINLNFSNL